jgi:hypothetical protein
LSPVLVQAVLLQQAPLAASAEVSHVSETGDRTSQNTSTDRICNRP